MKNKLTFYRATAAVFLGIFISIFCYFNFYAYSAPILANYILGTLPQDSDSIAQLAKFDLLVVSAEQGAVRRSVLQKIRELNSKIIILAYVPSQSTNDSWKEYPANQLYGNFQMNDNWWLRDTAGRPISDWPRLHNTDLSQGWSDYMINFVKNNILSQGLWDGVFYDMFYDSIADRNHGDIDLNRDGIKDDPTWANAQWVSRMSYLLSASQQRLGTKYIMINGNSIPSLQSGANGRMYENYPTPWEAGGSWSGIMTGLRRNQSLNAKPQIYVFNANTNNTGNQKDYRRMRFGLMSSLMMDNVYFSFDYGDRDHNQNWWYDEYNVNLGNSVAPAISQNGQVQFNVSDIWRRDYEHGIALVNPSNAALTIDLGNDFEKIIGKQDPYTNNGEITSNVTIPARDGLIMMKTAQTLQNVSFKNGGFVRFFDIRGARVRNGFFAFEDGVPGGAIVFRGDLNQDGTPEKIVSYNGRLQIFNNANQIWYDNYPYNGNYDADLRFAVAQNHLEENQILVTPAVGGAAFLYDYHGGVIKDEFYPFGPKYKTGFYGGLGHFDSMSNWQMVFGSGGKQVGTVLVYDIDNNKVKYKFLPFGNKYLGAVKVAVGNFTGDEKSEIAVMGRIGNKNIMRIFDVKGKKLSEFVVSGVFGGADLNISTSDINFDGFAEIVVVGE